MDLEYSIVNEEDLEKYEMIDIATSYIFSFINIIILIFSISNLKSKKNNINLLKNKYFSFFVIDVIIRILYITTYYHSNIFLKEIFFSFMPTSQFFLIISFLEQILNYEELLYLSNSLKKANSIELCILFFLFNFSYDKFSFSFSKHISFLQSIVNLGCIYKLYEYLNEIVIIIIDGINSKNSQGFNPYYFIKNLPLSCLFFYIVFHILKILIIFVNNTLYLIYMKIILIILKETSKYFIILILGAILFLIDRKNLNFETNKNNKKNVDFSEEKTKINANINN